MYKILVKYFQQKQDIFDEIIILKYKLFFSPLIKLVKIYYKN